MKKLILRNHLCPGDVLAMTAAIYSLHRNHPGQFSTAVETSCDEIFWNNPDVVPVTEDAERVEMHYPIIHECNQKPWHFLDGYCKFLEDNLNIPVPRRTLRPVLYLTNEEKEYYRHWNKPFWLVNAGRKNDFTTKYWGWDNYSDVIRRLRLDVKFIQIGDKGHCHPRLYDTLNMIGQTSVRELILLAYHAHGGLGGITLLGHIMAALQKPYVCIAGGREPVSWVSYPNQHLFENVGKFHCGDDGQLRDGGCWKNRVVALGDADDGPDKMCRLPTLDTSGRSYIPQCMASISPVEVAEKILALSSTEATNHEQC